MVTVEIAAHVYAKSFREEQSIKKRRSYKEKRKVTSQSLKQLRSRDPSRMQRRKGWRVADW